MRTLRALAALAAMLAGSAPAWAKAGSASAEASAIAGKMTAAGAALGTLALVVAGYFYMTGHGDRQTLALWAAGFAVLLCAPFFAGLLT